MYLEVLYCSFL